MYLLVDQDDIPAIAKKLNIDIDRKRDYESKLTVHEGSWAFEIDLETFSEYMDRQFAGWRRPVDCPSNYELYSAFVESRPIIRNLKELTTRYYLNESGPRLEKLADDEVSCLPVFCYKSGYTLQIEGINYKQAEIDLEEGQEGKLKPCGGTLYDLFSFAEDIRNMNEEACLDESALFELAEHATDHKSFFAKITVDPRGYNGFFKVEILPEDENEDEQ